MSRASLVCRDLGMSVNRNEKNQLPDYMHMTTGPARLADPVIAIPGSRLTGLNIFHVIVFTRLAGPTKGVRAKIQLAPGCLG